MILKYENMVSCRQYNTTAVPYLTALFNSKIRRVYLYKSFVYRATR